jgi:hypothetical protein
LRIVGGHSTVFARHKSNKTSANFCPCLSPTIGYLLDRTKDRGAAMLQSLSWITTDNLARSQLRMFSEIGEQMQLCEDTQRRLLLLSEQEWADWSDFRREGPLPAQPQLPVMLRRLGSASHRLAVIAERRAALA